MRRVLMSLLALQMVVPASGLAAVGGASRKAKGGEARVKRELKKRMVRITDDSGVTPIHVSAGIPTSLSFLLEVDAERVLLADSKDRFFDPQVTGRTVVVVPKVDLASDERVVLQVVVADGTLVPFTLVTVATDVDLAIDVELELRKRAGPESVAALKASVAEVQGRLDECQASAGEQGMAKVAALVLAQDPSKPEAFVVEKHAVRQLDKQSRLLVEAQHLYRLFELSYLVVSVENRDPSRAWVLDRAEVAVQGGSSTTDTRVVAVAEDSRVVGPGEVGRMVVGFKTVSQEAAQRYTLKLYEKGGPRHVEMSF